MTKTASTEGLTKTIQAKTSVQNSGQSSVQNTGIDPYKKAQSYLKAMLPQITEALPRTKGMSPENLVRITLTTLRLNPKLLECSIESLLGATLQAAQLGLQPNLLNSCYFIPYKGQVSFQIGYKGLIDLACRSGQVLSVVAQEVRKGDQFNYEFGRNETLKHIPAPEHLRGEAEYYYAYAHLKNGGFTFQVMHISEVEKIRDEHSISYRYDKNNSIWAKYFQSMAYKSVIKKLIKYLPLSVDTEEKFAADETVRKDITGDSFFVNSTEIEEIEIIDLKENGNV